MLARRAVAPRTLTIRHRKAAARHCSSSGSSGSSGSFSFEAWLKKRQNTALPPKTSSADLEQYFQIEASLFAKTVQMITSFRRWGHTAAQTDPLGLSRGSTKLGLASSEFPPNLRLESYKFTPSQLTSMKPVDVSSVSEHYARGFSSSERSLPLRRLHERLRDVYTGSVGVEYMHIRSQRRRDWLRDRLETIAPPVPSKAERLRALQHLCWADSFARFCGTNFRLTKRFGLEGCESLIVGLNGLVERAGEAQVEYIVMGMPHRGRLNVMANVVRKPLVQIFRDFRGTVQGTPVANDEWCALHSAAIALNLPPSGVLVRGFVHCPPPSPPPRLRFFDCVLLRTRAPVGALCALSILPGILSPRVQARAHRVHIRAAVRWWPRRAAPAEGAPRGAPPARRPRLRKRRHLAHPRVV